MDFKNYRKDQKDQILSYNILDEAKFSSKDIKRAGDLLAKIASKKLGTKFYFAWGEDFKKSSGPAGFGLRYLSTSGQQLRFNNIKNTKSSYSINSVDYWKSGAALTKPSMSLYFDPGINIVKLKEQLFDAIKKGKVPAITGSQLAESEAESALNEGLSKIEQKKEHRKSFAIKHGLDISKEWKYGKAELQRQAQAAGLEDEFNDWMSVKKGDSEKNSTEDGISQAEKDYANNIYSDPDIIFNDIESLLTLVAKKEWRSMMVMGDPGIGKTFHVTEGDKSLSKILGPQGDKWILHTATKAAPFSFYKTLFQERDKVIVFDEADSLLKNTDIIMLLKSLLDTSGSVNYAEYMSGTKNMVGYGADELEDYAKMLQEELADGATITTGREKPGQVKLPSKFPFTGSMVFISNLPASAVDGAVLSRSIFFDVALAAQDKIKRIEMITKAKAAKDSRITDRMQERLMTALGKTSDTPEYKINYMTPEYARSKKEITVRAAELGMKILLADDIPDGDKDRLIALYT